MGFPTAAQAHAVSPVAPVACPQDLLEPLLLRNCVERGGEVLFRTEVVGLAQDADGVTVGCDTGTPDGPGLTARYVVGADGPRSRSAASPASGRTSSAGSATTSPCTSGPR